MIERPKNRTNTSEEKISKISKDYLSYLLKYTNQEGRSEGSPFDAFLFGINYSSGITFPQNLIDQLDFGSKNFIELSRDDSLTKLYLGQERQEEDTLVDRNCEKADAAVEISRKSETFPDGNIIIPTQLRLASVNKKLSRIILARYNLLEIDCPLTEVNISTKESDFSATEKDSLDTIMQKRLLQQVATFNLGKFELLHDRFAGLITSKMCKTINPAQDTQGSLFTYKLNPKSDIAPVFHDVQVWEQESPAAFVFSKLGYYVNQENGLVKIGLNNDHAIILPKSLKQV
jgi:hypothetical protein